jgi:predicted esterase
MMPEAHHLRVVKRARYYTLGEREGVRDVWLVCHGYGQLAGRFCQSFATIAAPGRLIVAPEALHRFYLDPPPAPAAQRRVGATWMTREDRERDIADYIDYLDALVTEVLAHNPMARLRALGFSQGSATVLRWAVQASRVPHQILLWAGEVPSDVDWNMGARKLAQTQIIAVRGDRDKLAPQANFENNLRALAEAGLDVQQIEFSGGHHLDDALLVRLAQA